MRWDLWRGWARLPGWEGVKNRVWELASPLLWARLEKHIADFRGAKAEEPPANIAAKLTEDEIKKWKSESRRRQRNRSSSECNLLTQFLVQVEGAQAAKKLLDLTSSPGLRELAEEARVRILQQLALPPRLDSTTQLVLERTLPQWYLDDEWRPILEHFAPLALDSKQRWQYFGSPWAASSLAVGFYRLNTEESRARCRELAPHADNLSHLLASVVRHSRDLETWFTLLEKVQWPHPDLMGFWDDLRRDDTKTSTEILPRLLEILSATPNEPSAKTLLEMLAKVSDEELAPHLKTVAHAIENLLPVVARWALKELSKAPQAEIAWENVVQVAGEKLWSENGALAKDAAKFLGALGAKNLSLSASAWEKLDEATALENLALLEAVFRALSQIRTKNRELTLDENASARLEELVSAQRERFAGFQKRLV